MEKSFFFLLVVLTSFSCREQIPPKSIDSRIFTAEGFPITLGSYWEYNWWDVQWFRNDTLRGTIIKKDISISDKKELWMLEWKWQNLNARDTQYIQYNDSSLRFYDYLRFYDSLKLESEYSFPFQLGDNWEAVDQMGRYSVLGDSVNATDRLQKDFGLGYFLERNADEGNDFSIHEKLILVPGIGVIWRNFNFSQGVPIDIELFELIDYEIK